MRRTVRTIWLPVLLWAAAPPLGAQTAPDDFPRRVLITNDNGIDDPKIVALARAFAAHAETWVVAPSGDRSGSGSYLTVTRTGVLDVETRDLGPGIRAFAVDGYPADCVILALLGLMADAPPDLIVSGVNGGANLGSDWFGSGTVGAARIGAFAGVPAIAVSGLDDDLPGAVEAAVDWVVRLAASDIVRALEPPDYLTVSLPRVVPAGIRGVRFADRAPPLEAPALEPEGPNRWRVTGALELDRPIPPDSDRAAWDAGYIVIVPMRADEVDFERLARWRRQRPPLPGWAPR